MGHAETSRSQSLELDPATRLTRLGDKRSVLIDVAALGTLRSSLLEYLGVPASRAVMTQFGFVQGWRMAGATAAQCPDWGEALLKLGARDGLFSRDASSDSSQEGISVLDSYEPQQVLDRTDTPPGSACWFLPGLASGYASRCCGKVVHVVEESCEGKGDACCHLVGRTAAAWHDEPVDQLMRLSADDLQASLQVPLQPLLETMMLADARRAERPRLRQRGPAVFHAPERLVARSPTMRTLVDLARRVARVDSTVLLTGESGTGKERIARLVHDESGQAQGPFVAVNCGAITETLLESELFGHARGAFTGATGDRPGLFEAAHTGTLLLDEVGEVSMGMQVKLLRALQEREVRRVGENKSRKVDVRVLAATNRDLSQAVASGAFRQDLYYRLKVVELHVPALRDRGEDLLPLAWELLAEAAARLKRPLPALSAEAAEQLQRHRWPGNVRELENAMERAVALARDAQVNLDDLPEDIQRLVESALLPGGVRALHAIEREYIEAALARNGGNRARTAGQLQIGSATLYRKLKSYALDPPRS